MNKLKISILAPLALFFIVLVGGFTGGVYFWQENRDAEALQTSQINLNNIFDRLVIDETSTMKAALQGISINKEISQLYLARDRDKLLAATRPIFGALFQNHRITHFYFTDVDRVNFLRVHQPDRFGDTINRETMLLTQRNQTMNAGLELGPLGTYTLRTVMPWVVDGHLIGYLELGEEIDHLMSNARDFLAMDLHVFIPKSNLMRKDWEDGIQMLGYRADWDQLERYVVNEFVPLPSFLIDHVNTGGLEHSGIIKGLKWGDRTVSLLHKPIIDAHGDADAVIVAIHDETDRDSTRTQFILGTVIASIAIASALFVLFWFILEQVERDIRRYEENLIQAKKVAESSSLAKSQFLATMSHELRTPLNAILGFSDIMRTQAFGPIGSEKYLEYARDIHFSGLHLLTLINDILHISKIEAGGHRLHMERFDIAELIGECLPIVHERAKASNIALVTHLENDLPLILADRRAIQQCLINLLANAIKFTPPDGTVTLSVSVTPRWFDLVIADTGIGIAEEDLPKLTQPFTQIERTRTGRIQEGTGLGLTITRNLVEMHGGTLKIESELTVGTTVTIHLPRGRAEQNEDTPEHPSDDA